MLRKEKGFKKRSVRKEEIKENTFEKGEGVDVYEWLCEKQNQSVKYRDIQGIGVLSYLRKIQF